MQSPAALRAFLVVAGAMGSLVAPSAASAQPSFTNASSSWLGGLNLTAWSASLADFDRDGDLDLYFQGSNNSHNNRLWENNIVGAGTANFTNRSVSGNSSLPSGLAQSWSAAWADYDGDQKIDVFVGQTNSSSNVGDVLKNAWPSPFINASTAINLDDPGFHQSVAWSDIDSDRDLDLVIAMEGPEPHEIYRQGPGHTFSPMGAASGLHIPFQTVPTIRYGKAYGMAIGDTDGDGDRDIYMSTCQPGGNIRKNFFENRLIHNGVNTGVLSFVDIAGDSPTDPNGNGTQFMVNGYGAEFHDFNDDGRLDLFVVGADGQPSKIFRNDGGNEFTDVDSITGHSLLSDTGGDLNGSRAVDYDNDGDLDLFFHDHLRLGATQDSARSLYRNDGNWAFTDVTAAEGLFNINQGAYDSVWGDLDRDGDMDLVAPTEISAAEQVFINGASTNGNHWLQLRLAGPADNTTGIGAEVYATIHEGTPQERTLRRDSNANAGAFNQSDIPVHFGLGAADQIDLLRIVWPDGTDQVLHDVAVDRYLTVHAPGDFNGDGLVDALDFAQWQGDFGENDDSDVDLDGDSDGADFLAWQRQYANGMAFLTPSTTSVPEPTGALPLAFTLAAIIRVRRR